MSFCINLAQLESSMPTFIPGLFLWIKPLKLQLGPHYYTITLTFISRSLSPNQTMKATHKLRLSQDYFLEIFKKHRIKPPINHRLRYYLLGTYNRNPIPSSEEITNKKPKSKPVSISSWTHFHSNLS